MKQLKIVEDFLKVSFEYIHEHFWGVVPFIIESGFAFRLEYGKEVYEGLSINEKELLRRCASVHESTYVFYFETEQALTLFCEMGLIECPDDKSTITFIERNIFPEIIERRLIAGEYR